MKYRVLRYFEGEENSYTLIGHYDLKRQASMAITDDQMNHKNSHDLKYKIDEVVKELTQTEIDRIFNAYKAGATK